MPQEKLLLPALRANMGDWTYYIATMTLEELAQRVTTATRLHKSKKLDELIQRPITSRSKEIADYLLSQPQRFFGALVVGVHGGGPEWLEVAIKESARPWHEDGDRLDGAIGYLRLSGSEDLLALDGQHRLVGIKQALRTDPSLGDEEVMVIFVGHKAGQAGLDRTRQLLTTLHHN